MICPKCHGRVEVKDSVNVAWNEIYRRRQCVECGHVFYTAEFEVEQNHRFEREWFRFYKKKKKKMRARTWINKDYIPYGTQSPNSYK